MIVTSLFARLGFQVDAASLIRVRRVLTDLEARIARMGARRPIPITVNTQQALTRIRQVEQALARLNQRSRATAASMRGLQVRTRAVAGAMGGGGGAGAAAGAGLAGRIRSVGRSMRHARTENAALINSFQAMTGNIRRLWAWWVTLSAAIGAGGRLIEEFRQTEQLRLQLATVTGGVAQGAQAFQFIVEAARDLPGSIDDVSTAYIRLSQLGIPVTRDLLEEMGNFGAAFGTNVGDIIKAASDLAVGVARPFELLTGVNADMRSDASKIIFMWRGQRVEIERNTEAILNWMREQGRTTFTGAVGRWMASYVGALEKMGDSFKNFIRVMGDAGLKNALADLFRVIGLTLDSSDDMAVRLGQYLARGVRKLTDAVVWLSKNLERVLSWLSLVGGVAVSASIARLGLTFARTFGMMLNPLNLVIGSLLLIPLLLDDLAGFARGDRRSLIAAFIPKEDQEEARTGISSMFMHLTAAMDAIIGTIGLVIESFGKLFMKITGAENLGQALDIVGMAIRSIAEAIRDIVGALLEFVSSTGVQVLIDIYRHLTGASRPAGMLTEEDLEPTLFGAAFGTSAPRQVRNEERQFLFEQRRREDWSRRVQLVPELAPAARIMGLIGRRSTAAEHPLLAGGGAGDVNIGELNITVPGYPMQDTSPEELSRRLQRGGEQAGEAIRDKSAAARLAEPQR